MERILKGHDNTQINIIHAHDNGMLGNRVKVVQMTRDGDVVAEFESMTAAARSIGFTNGAIQACVAGKKQVRRWIFLETERIMMQISNDSYT